MEVKLSSNFQNNPNFCRRTISWNITIYKLTSTKDSQPYLCTLHCFPQPVAVNVTLYFSQNNESCPQNKNTQPIEHVLVLSANTNSRRKKWRLGARLYILLRSSQSFIHLHPSSFHPFVDPYSSFATTRLCTLSSVPSSILISFHYPLEYFNLFFSPLRNFFQRMKDAAKKRGTQILFE